MNKNNVKDVQSSIALILFAIAFYGFSFRIQPTTSDVLGSRFFPQAAAILLMLLCVIQLVRAFRSKEVLTAEEEEKIAKADRINAPLILTTIVLFAFYILCYYIGFGVSAMFFLLAASFILMPEAEKNNKKTKLIVIAVAILFPIFLEFVFYKIFHIQLPLGKLIQIRFF